MWMLSPVKMGTAIQGSLHEEAGVNSGDGNYNYRYKKGEYKLGDSKFKGETCY